MHAITFSIAAIPSAVEIRPFRLRFERATTNAANALARMLTSTDEVSEKGTAMFTCSVETRQIIQRYIIRISRGRRYTEVSVALN